MVKMESSFIGELVTIGRKSKKEHRVYLRLVHYNSKYYASRRNTNSDWLKNLIVNPETKIIINGKVIKCLAKIVDDQELTREISRIKYDDERASMNRVVVELVPL